MFIILFFMFGSSNGLTKDREIQISREQIQNNDEKVKVVKTESVYNDDIETKNTDDDIFFSNKAETYENIKQKIDSVQSNFVEHFSENEEFYSDFEEAFFDDDFSNAEEDKTVYDLIDIESGTVFHQTKEDSNKKFYITVLLRDIYLVDISLNSKNFQYIDYVYSLFFGKPPQSSNILKEILLSGELFDFSNVNSESNVYFLVNPGHIDKLFHVFAYDDVYNPILLASDVEIKCEDAMVTKDFIGWGLYIYISGEKCSKIKYLQISFDNSRYSKNFRFKHLNGRFVSDIWMKRKKEKFDQDEKQLIWNNIISQNRSWLKNLSVGYDVFYELESIPKNLKRYNEKKE